MCDDRRVRVAALQSGLAGYDERALAVALERCTELSIDLLVLPECYVGGIPPSIDAAGAVAMSAPYPRLVSMLGGCPSSTTVVAGFVERGADEAVFSSAAVIRAGSILGVSRKLFPIEPVFTAGTELPTYRLGDHTFGVVLCYDANFIEPARLLALAGARILVCPLNNGLPERTARRWIARTHANLVARAVENDCWVIVADVCGAKDGRIGVGATRVVAPDGRVVAAAADGTPDLVVADVDVGDVSLLPRWDVRSNGSVAAAWIRSTSCGSGTGTVR